MATNSPFGDGHRNGAVRKRSQVYNPKTEQWVKRDKDTGRFMDVKQDGTPFDFFIGQTIFCRELIIYFWYAFVPIYIA